MRLSFLKRCSQLCLFSNQIAVVIDHQKFWRQSICILVFLHGDSHQGKVASDTTFWLCVASCASRPIRLRTNQLMF